MGFSPQEYWSGLPCPPLGDLPNLAIEPTTPALQVDSSLLSHQGHPYISIQGRVYKRWPFLSEKDMKGKS